MSIFEVALESFIDMNHELVLLSKQIDWEAVESEFAEYYCAERHQYADGCRRLQYEALDEQKCLVFFCFLAEDGDQRPRECDIWKRKPICLSILDSRDGREKWGLAGLTK